jgi:hypothetical protein
MTKWECGCNDKEGSKLFKLERRRDEELEDDCEDRSGSAHGLVRRGGSNCIRGTIACPCFFMPFLFCILMSYL